MVKCCAEMATVRHSRLFRTIVALAGVFSFSWFVLFAGRLPVVEERQQLRKNHEGKVRRSITEANSGVRDVHVCLNYDGHYLVGLIALVNSTIAHCSRNVVFHLVSDAPEEQVQTAKMLRSLFPQHAAQGNFQFKTLDTELVPYAKVWASYRSSSLSKPIVFARYVLPNMFPELDRLVYLDQDILVTKDIAPLYDMDLEGYPLAAARLCRQSALFAQQLQMIEPELSRFNPSECTLNNGVLVYDMAKWRKSNYTDQLFYWTRLNNAKKLYMLGSQPPFNLVFYHNYKILDKYWNLMDIAGLKVGQEPITVSREDILQSALLHWNGELKPWMCEEGHYAELWRSYFPTFLTMVGDQYNSNRKLCDTVVITDTNLRLHDPRSQFTVVITSHKRVHNLVHIVNHLRRSDYIKEIFLVWNSLKPCPEEVTGLVRCFPQPNDHVHNRFSVWPEVTTEGVLQHGDDVIIPLQPLEAAFKIWRQHSHQILGFEPRVVRCKNDTLPDCNYSSEMRNSSFDLVIGKMFFVANKYQELLFQPALINLTSRVPCEDLAINYMVGQVSGLPPLWFQVNLRSELHDGLSQGISSTKWQEMRHGCISELNTFFGGQTVLPSSTKYSLNKACTLVIKMPITKNNRRCSDSRPCRQPQ